MKPLEGKIILVAGATRGAGRGIASMLGEAGATVYCSGRSVKGAPASGPSRPETIDETAEIVTELGGIGIPVRTDHSKEEEVIALMDRIQKDHGHLDVLVNDVWGGDALMQWNLPFWENDLSKGFQMMRQAIDTHIITAKYAVPLMLPAKKGLIVEVTDGDGYFYRGQLFYDLVKTTVIRLAYDMSQDLEPHGIGALAITPGFLRSEAMLEHFGVTESNWKDGTRVDPNFIASETPWFVGRAVAALAADPAVFEKEEKYSAPGTSLMNTDSPIVTEPGHIGEITFVPRSPNTSTSRWMTNFIATGN
ncbi:SDR family oxidoreductase [Chitinophaga caseinilytica]|uniref:SDR family oxidoreductase n=1 Tax=Chitinophaga caseinilytica TaxID=2267521 RepID=A0ABZ2Z7N6_9BACT